MSIGALSSKHFFHQLNQSALFRLGSKRRLATVLGVPLESIGTLRRGPDRYRIFETENETCLYTGTVNGGRPIQDPAATLKSVQRRIVRLLRRVEVPSYCHGGVKGASYRTNAEAHRTGLELITFDLRKYYPSTPSTRVFSFFHRQLECSPDVAEILTDLCCLDGILPTGAPTSPLISYFANSPLFARLSVIAAEYGLVFTVYIDDLTFSGRRIPVDLARRVAAAAKAGGHELSSKKTRFFDANAAKHVTGVVIVDRELSPPARRFQKARGIAAARAATSDLVERVRLSRQLAGLLGEAAQIAPKLRPWAKREYATLAEAESAALAAGVTVPSKKQPHRALLRPSAMVVNRLSDTDAAPF